MENKHPGQPEETSTAGHPFELERLRRRVSKLEGVREDFLVQQETARSRADMLEISRQSWADTQRYFELYEFSPVALVILDRIGCIQDLNQAACGLLGSSRLHLTGIPLLSLIEPFHQRSFLAHLRSCRNGMGGIQTDVSLHRREVPPIPVRLSTQRRLSESWDEAYPTVILDLSEWKDHGDERQGYRNRERALRLASEAKDRFLAVLSHELRTPLTPILAATSALERRDDLPGPVKELLQIVQRNAEMEGRLVDDLLDVTRIVNGKLRLEQIPVNTHLVLEEIASALVPELQTKSVRIGLSLESKRPWVAGDPLRLHQVFSNILRNAIRFSFDGGSIEVSTSDDPTALRVRIEDHGGGIDPKELENIFSPFVGDSGRGLGLGLAIARGLVEAHQGTIRARSEGPGKGSIFEIVLPEARDSEHRLRDSGLAGLPALGGRTEADPPAPAGAGTTVPTETEATVPEARAATGKGTAARKLRILLVEDHPDSARMLSMLISAAGHEVEVAPTAAAAFSAAKRPFDLLISDIGLPDGSGIDLMRQIRKKHPIVGIALSGFGTEQDIRRSLDAGFREHLTKPIALEKLQAAIARAAETGPEG